MSDAYMLGEDAYSRGDSLEMNPYDERDAQHDEWDDGYSAKESNNVIDTAKELLKENSESNRKLPYDQLITCIESMVNHLEEVELETNKLNEEIQAVMQQYWKLQREK